MWAGSLFKSAVSLFKTNVQPNYHEEYVAQLFNQMGPSYEVVNLVSSFGFSEIWRAQCVRSLRIATESVVADLMAGSGGCWPYILQRLRPGGRIIAVDISPVMCHRQKQRASQQKGNNFEIRHENALTLGLPDASVDYVVSAFGLKTFNEDQLRWLAAQIFRILKTGGTCSLLEISLPESPLLRLPYSIYINWMIPFLGRIFLKDIECYRMLGVYTAAFKSCRKVMTCFSDAGFEVAVKQHCWGCATSLILKKP